MVKITTGCNTNWPLNWRLIFIKKFTRIVLQSVIPIWIVISR